MTEQKIRLHKIAHLWRSETPDMTRLVGPSGLDVGREVSRFIYDTVDAQVDSVISAFGLAGCEVLDVGAASGNRAEAFARMHCKVTALDFRDESEQMYKRNVRLEEAGMCPIEFMQADIRQIEPFAEKKFKVIHARKVLHFIDSLEKVRETVGNLSLMMQENAVFVTSLTTYSLGENACNNSGKALPSISHPRMGGVTIHDMMGVFRAINDNGLQVSDIFVGPHTEGFNETAFFAKKSANHFHV